MKNKKIKDMTSEEYKEYKKEYAKKYNKKKKEIKEQQKKNQISNKLKGKAKKNFESSFENDDVSIRTFSKYKKDAHFGIMRLDAYMRPVKINCFFEFFISLNITYKSPNNVIMINIGVRIFSSKNKKIRKNWIITRSIWEKDISHLGEELNNKNFSKNKNVNKEIDKFFNFLRKGSTINFLKMMISSAKDPRDMLLFLWNSLDDTWVKNSKKVDLDVLMKSTPKKQKKIILK